jgi:hypothetical protein
MTRARETGVSVVLAVSLAAAANFPVIAQQTQAVEDWRAIRAETTGVMLDLDAANNVFAVGETLSQVVTRARSQRAPSLGALRAIASPASSRRMDIDRPGG